MKYWFPVLLAGWMSVAHAGLFGGDDELLPVDQAFAFKASVDADGRIHADWKIADGYYLYKDKFHFSSADGGASLGKADFPPAKVKHDEIFGTVETYATLANHHAHEDVPLRAATLLRSWIVQGLISRLDSKRAGDSD